MRRLSPLLLLLLVTAAAVPAATAQSDEVIDEIVAVVGDQIILRSDVDGLALSFMQQSRQPYSEALWNEALSQLIDQRVLTIHARRDTTIIVSDDQVDQALDQRIRQMAAQVGGEAQLEQMYGQSVVEIKADFREEFRDQLLAEQFQNRRLSQIRVTPSDVERWFAAIPQDSLPVLPDLVRVSHIVRYPDVTEAARQEAREIIGAIRDSIVVSGAAFEEMARAFSDDPGSAAQGGRYQNMKVSEFAPEFAAVASRIPVGEVSQVFETTFGLHILRVNERRGDVVDLNHILIQFDDRDTDASEAVAMLEAVRDSALTHGVPFEVLARRHSEEEGTARSGGRVVDPRTGERNLFVQALGRSWQQTLDGMEPGDISEPAEAELLDGRRAWHVVKLHRYVPEHRVNLDADYEMIQNYALREKQNAELRTWLDRLRRDVYIDVRAEPSDLSMARN